MFHPLLIYGLAKDAADRDAAKSIAETAHEEAHTLKTTVGLLQYDIERLLMISEALWIILKQKHGYQDEDLTKIVSEIDLRDGKLDGRMTVESVRKCPNCGNVLGKKRPFCYYCGKSVELGLFER